MKLEIVIDVSPAMKQKEILIRRLIDLRQKNPRLHKSSIARLVKILNLARENRFRLIEVHGMKVFLREEIRNLGLENAVT